MTLPSSALPWTFALLALAAAVLVIGIVASRAGRRRRPEPLPTQWTLNARPVFSSAERRAYRVLREAFPHHVVLAKLPLVRLCQPDDANDMEYWFDLLSPHHVTFAVCSATGRVLAAIDLEQERANSRRGQQIKRSVLEACHIRYLRCTPESLPSTAELQLLVPAGAPAPRGADAAPAGDDLHSARAALASTVATRRATRSALWQESTSFQDSFFAPESRNEITLSSGFGPLGATTLPMSDSLPGLTIVEGPEGDIAGIVEADVATLEARPARPRQP